MFRPSRKYDRRTRAALVLGVLALSLTGCQGEVRRTGQEPTRDWPGAMPCPSTLRSVCSDRQLRLQHTINEPQGTVFGIVSEGRIFVICRWQDPAGQPLCEAMPRTGAEVAGEAAIYRVDG